MQNKWAKKLMAGLLILLFLIVCISGLLFYFIFTGDLKDRLTRTNMELLEHMNQKLELVLKSVDNESVQLVQNDEVQKFFDEKLPSEEAAGNDFRLGGQIDRLISSDDYIFSIDMYSYSQHRLVSGDVLTEERKLEDYGWINTFETFDGYFEWLPSRQLVINRSSSPIYRNVVTLVRTYPLLHSVGARKGAMALNLKTEMLLSLIHNEDEDLGETFIVDETGQIVLHPAENKLGQNIGQSSYIHEALSRKSRTGNFHSQVDQKPSMVFYTDSPYTGWTLIRTVSDLKLNQPLIALRNTLAVISAMILIAAAAMGLALGKWTFRPLNRFLHTLSVKLNEYSPQAKEIDRADDLQFLESAFEGILVQSDQLHKQMQETRPMLKWQLLMELLSNYKINISNVVQYMEMLGIQFHPNRFVVLNAELDRREEIAAIRDVHLYNYALCNLAEELILAEGKGAAIELENGTCAIIISFADDDADAELRAVAVAELIKSYVEEHFRRTISIGVGGLVESMTELHKSFKQSKEALSYRLVFGANSIITREDIHSDLSPRFYRLVAMTEDMMDSLKLLDGTKLREQVERWFEAFAEYGVPPQIIRQLSLQCLMKAAEIAEDVGIGHKNIQMPQELQESLNTHKSLEEIKEFLMKTLQGHMEAFKEKRSSREKNGLILKVLEYIHDNYSRTDLSLNLLAEEYRVSVSHLSKLFKEQTEGNFIDYLMALRMAEAKRLLEETDGKIMDIAEAVGYGNVNSFVRIFKKFTALTPSEYREQRRK